MLDPTVIARLNEHMPGLGDAIETKVKAGVEQGINDYLTELNEQSIGTSKMPDYAGVARAALLTLIEH